ncbi:MAG: hypothetical protein ACYDDA_05840 [Acidiferrobacteraceae bacterium]
MKTFLILLGIGVAGYFGYEYFIAKNQNPFGTGFVTSAGTNGIIYGYNASTGQALQYNPTTKTVGAQ